VILLNDVSLKGIAKGDGKSEKQQEWREEKQALKSQTQTRISEDNQN